MKTFFALWALCMLWCVAVAAAPMPGQSLTPSCSGCAALMNQPVASPGVSISVESAIEALEEGTCNSSCVKLTACEYSFAFTFTNTTSTVTLHAAEGVNGMAGTVRTIPPNGGTDDPKSTKLELACGSTFFYGIWSTQEDAMALKASSAIVKFDMTCQQCFEP